MRSRNSYISRTLSPIMLIFLTNSALPRSPSPLGSTTTTILLGGFRALAVGDNFKVGGASVGAPKGVNR